MATQWTAGLTASTPLPAATLNSIGAQSVTYTPTWTSTGTQPAIGNGTLTARYFQIQKIVFVELLFIAGSTTTYGTGNYSFSVPITARTGLYGYMSNGIARLYDASTAQATFSQTGFYASATNAVVVYLTGTGGLAGQTSPFTWASTDEIIMSFQYEAA